ncbi:MAG: sulfur transferase domain-containing protein [Vicinamibacterales bacterium]
MHSRSLIVVSSLVVLAGLSAGSALAQQVTKETVPGIRNLARLETTVACAGVTAVEAVPEIKKMGFVSIINLREATEPGADVEKEAEAAKAVGLRYFHVPFNGASPTTQVADQFLAAITSPGAEPAFIHCSAGNRAATMWLIKRIAVDRWDVERATQEAIALGQTSPTLRQFAIDYGLAHRR